MNTSRHYFEQLFETAELEALIQNCVKHMGLRFELGSVVFVCDQPEQAYKLIEKHWKKLTRQIQEHRQKLSDAAEILEVTRSISRRQRLQFSTQSPSEDPAASCYIVTTKQLDSVPQNCYTLYHLSGKLTADVFKQLPSDALVVGRSIDLPELLPKQELANQISAELSNITDWLQQQKIDLAALGSDIKKSTEALDKLLSDEQLCRDFNHMAEKILRLYMLAQPLKVAESPERLISNLNNLHTQAKALSPAYLSEQLLDNQSDDAFLLRDIARTTNFSLSGLKEFISEQYRLGHNHLATALERKLGFIRI